MIKIFLLTEGAHDDFHVVGAFSSRQKAEDWLNEKELDALRVQHPNAFGVAEYGYLLWDEKWQYEIQEIDLDDLKEPLKWIAKQTDRPNPRVGQTGGVTLIFPSRFDY